MARSRQLRSGASGQLSYKPESDEGPIPKVLEFVIAQLPSWRDDPNRPKDAAERRLNSSLCDYLDSCARFECPMVRFKHEDPQLGPRTVDLGVHGVESITFIGTYGYTIYEPFMVVECKRLPSPTSDREREYVTGENKSSGAATGAIQRFKLGLHGSDVTIAAIVGYLEREDPSYWQAVINRWIGELVVTPSDDGCVWSIGDLLEHVSSDPPNRMSQYKSAHSRSNSRTPSIAIHHLWIAMTTGQN